MSIRDLQLAVGIQGNYSALGETNPTRVRDLNVGTRVLHELARTIRSPHLLGDETWSCGRKAEHVARNGGTARKNA